MRGMRRGNGDTVGIQSYDRHYVQICTEGDVQGGV